MSDSALPPIVVATEEARRLCALANSNMTLFPSAAVFLAREMSRANVVANNENDLRRVVAWAPKFAIATIRPGT